jgi:hypothetical protein
VGSGVTTSAKAQTANLNTRTVAVTLASATNIAAASGSIMVSTGIVASTVYIVTVASSKFNIDGNAQATLSLSTGSTYVFNQDDSSCDGNPLGFSSSPDKFWPGVYSSGVSYKLDNLIVAWPAFVSGFDSATTRRAIITPSHATSLYYYSPNTAGMGAAMPVSRQTSALQQSKLVIDNAVSEGSSSISYIFALNSPLETSTPDTIALLLPTFKFGVLCQEVEQEKVLEDQKVKEGMEKRQKPYAYLSVKLNIFQK